MRRGKLIIGLFTPLLMGQLLLCSVAWSEFRASPSFSLREEYNDNIDLEHDAESDFITLVGASYDIIWETRLFDISLNLGLEYEKYLDNSENDDLRPRQGSQLESTFNLYRDTILLRISDTYERVVIDEGDEGGIGNNLTNLTDSNRLEINPYAMFDLSSRMQLRLDYQYENQWYADEDGDDAEYHNYSATLTRAWTPHISSSLSGGFTQYRPMDSRDSLFDDTGEEEYDRQNLNFGLEWQPVEQLIFSANIGRSRLDYAFSDDYDSTLFGVGMDYQLSSTLNLALAYAEDINSSVEEGAREQKEYTLGLGYTDRISAGFELFSRTGEYLELDRQDDAMGGSLSAEIPLSNKFGVAGLLSYTDYQEDYPLYSDEYQRYGARFSLYRELRLGRISVGYTYNENDSDTINDNYTNNIVFAQLNLRW